MARAGCRVLVVERERKFRDRNRGEGMHPWGVAEARELGIERRLLDTCGHAVRWRNLYAGDRVIARRDMVATTPGKLSALDFYHPDMQTELLDLAEEAGAEVRRGTTVAGLTPGRDPGLELEDGRRERVSARFVIGADGRTSRVRDWAGFQMLRDPECLVIAGVLHGGLDLAEDTVHTVYNYARGQAVLIFPLGRGRFRSYFFYRRQGPARPLAGARHAADFVSACVETGAPAAWFARAEVLGPLAAFEGADRWVAHPYREGIALIGDAATISDPCFGAGLSLTLRDVRVLRDHLLTMPDWAAAGRAYAREHDGYYGAWRRLVGWVRDLYFGGGPEAEARRAHILPLLEREPERRPDLAGLGPDAPNDEAARRRLFGEDCPC
jgi:2-polyprenyl-6-methoxyphenol hydroxylase-like FAD-dependent oxidoreductase